MINLDTQCDAAYLKYAACESIGVRGAEAATSSNFYFKSNNGLLSIKSIFREVLLGAEFHVPRESFERFGKFLSVLARRGGSDLLLVRQARGFGCFRLVIDTAGDSAILCHKSQLVNFTISLVSQKYPFTSTSELQM